MPENKIQFAQEMKNFTRMNNKNLDVVQSRCNTIYKSSLLNSKKKTLRGFEHLQIDKVSILHSKYLQNQSNDVLFVNHQRANIALVRIFAIKYFCDKT